MAIPGRRNGVVGNEIVDGDPIEYFVPNVDSGSDSDDTPPHFRHLSEACKSGNLDNLRAALAELGPNGNIDEPIEDGDTALHLACLYGNIECVELLLQRNADIEAKDEEGAIPLHDACAGGYADIVEKLIIHPQEDDCVKRMLEAVDVEGDTPLHHAARGEHANVIQILLRAGASPLTKNIYNKTPGDLADTETEARLMCETAGTISGN